MYQFSSVQFSRSVLSNSLWPHGLQHARPPLSNTNSQSLLKLISIESVMSSSHLILCAPCSSCPQSFPASGSFPVSQLFVSGGHHIKSFSFSISSSDKYLGLIFFRIDLFDLLTVQGTLKSLLQHHSSKALVLRCSAFFYCPTLASIHNYWKNHSFDYTNLCWQSNVSAF